MRFGVIPTNLIERMILALGIGPTPLADTMLSLMLARTVMAGTKMGIFEELAAMGGKRCVTEIATRCGTDKDATAALLFALAGTGYLRAYGPRWGGHDAEPRYALAPLARKWMLTSSTLSLRDATLQRYFDLRLMDHFEEYVRTGRPVNFHQTMSSADWDVYQRGQRSHALITAPELARRLPIPRQAQAMLDIGGGHGYYSVAICRRYRGLHATILDLPDAIEHAAALLAQEKMGQRIVFRAGNALTDDLGSETYDIVVMASILHHFDDAANSALIQRVGRALRPGGICVIADVIRSSRPRPAGQTDALARLFFAATSASGTWSFADMKRWQRAAGLRPRPPISFIFTPGYGMQIAEKRR